MANFHLLSNHLPIVGTFLGLVLLLFALFKPDFKSAISAYVVMVISGIGGLIAYVSGGSAEHEAERIKGISHKVIHIHEEMAENTLFFIFALTALAVIGLWAEKSEWASARKIQIGALVVGIIAFILFAFTGYLGGHIRHGA